MKQHHLISAFLFTAVFALSGCTREPNQEELQALYVEQVQQTNQVASQIMRQKGDIIQVQSFEKIDCNKVADTRDYLCQAKVSVKLPFLGVQQNTADLHVTKGENGWVIAE